MPFPIIPVVATLGTAGLGYLIFGGKKSPEGQIDPTKPQGLDIPGKPGQPSYPGVKPPKKSKGTGLDLSQPAPPPTVSVPGKVIAVGGVWVHDKPDVNSTKLTIAGYGSKLYILNPTAKLPPSDGAPNGWWKVQNPNGIVGYTSAQFIMLGDAPPIPNKVLPPPPPAPEPSPAPMPRPSANTVQGRVTAKNGANIRDTPSTSGKVLQIKPFGSTVLVDLNGGASPTPGAPKGWYTVLSSTGGPPAYVSAELVDTSGAAPAPEPLPPGPAPVPAPQPAPGVMSGRVTSSNGLYVRSSASTSGNIVAALPIGAVVTIKDPNLYPASPGALSGWWKVQTSTGVVGFASARYLDVTTGPVDISSAKISGEDFPFSMHDGIMRDTMIKM